MLYNNTSNLNKYNYNYIYLFIHLFSNFIKNLKIINYVNNKNNCLTNYEISINVSNLKYIFIILKSSILLKFDYLIDMTCIDNLLLKKNCLRFNIIYVLKNIKSLSKVLISCELNTLNFIESLTFLYSTANWSEREIFDLFGIFFFNHPDLRRILTDYGFVGFPLKKDFPLTGYLELRYCEELKCVKYNKLKLMQEYRNFNFNSPWQTYLKYKTNN